MPPKIRGLPSKIAYFPRQIPYFWRHVSIKRKVPKRRVTYFGWPGKSVKKKVIFDDFFAVENKKKILFSAVFYRQK
jgi:hypothetical protein